MKISKNHQNKLFYNKWMYRVRCKSEFATEIRVVAKYGIEGAKLFYPKNNKLHRGEKEISDLTNLMKEFFEGEQYQVRIEGSRFSIFCNDIAEINRIQTVLNAYIKDVYGPTSPEEVELLTTNKRKTICNQLPHKLYTYKLFFNPSMTADVRKSFYEWISKYPSDKVKLSRKTSKWLSGYIHWNYAPFLYVIDGPMASMVTMHLGTDIKSIEEFIPRERINTPSGPPHHASIELTI